MNNLWSPWRSQYIDSFKHENKPDKCVLCESAKKDTSDNENLLIDKGKLAFTVLNLYPYNNGHLMIVPFRHTGEFKSLTDDENLEMMQMLQTAIKALEIIYKPHGFNIGANIGRVSGAGIEDHFHFHVVPRWNGDTNFMPVLGKVKVISQDLMETKKKLVEAYSNLK